MKNMSFGKLFCIFATISVLAACAAQPPANSPAGGAAVAAPATATAAPATAAAAASDKNEPPKYAGYRRVTKNGVDLFCSREGMTGSRTRTIDQCLTEAQLNAQLKAARDGSQDLLRRQQDQALTNTGGGNAGGR